MERHKTLTNLTSSEGTGKNAWKLGISLPCLLPIPATTCYNHNCGPSPTPTNPPGWCLQRTSSAAEIPGTMPPDREKDSPPESPASPPRNVTPHAAFPPHLPMFRVPLGEPASGNKNIAIDVTRPMTHSNSLPPYLWPRQFSKMFHDF